MRTLSIDDDPAVPLRGQGQTTADRERWSIVRFVCALVHAGQIPPSTSVVLRNPDKPDALLDTEREKIGVEIVEAVPQAYAHPDAVRNRERPDGLLDRSEFQTGGRAEKQSPRELIRDAPSPDRSPGWSGDAVEVELAVLVCDQIDTKRDKLASYERFDKDWLLLYASAPGPALDLAKAVTLIPESDRAVPAENFDRMFLMVNSRVACLGTGTVYPVPAVKQATELDG